MWRVVVRKKECYSIQIRQRTNTRGPASRVRGYPLIRHVRVVRHRPNIISEVSATAIARRGFGFTSVSRGALG